MALGLAGILAVLACCGCETGTTGDSDQLMSEAKEASAWVEQRYGGTEPAWTLGACIWGEYEPGNLGTCVMWHMGHEYAWQIWISETLREKPEVRSDVMRHELRHLRGVDAGLE
jgi:hypothetical protein